MTSREKNNNKDVDNKLLMLETTAVAHTEKHEQKQEKNL